MKSKSMLATILVVAFVVVAGGSFWLGTYYQEQNRMNQMRQFAGGGQSQPPGMPGDNQQGMPGRNQQGSTGTTGKVDKVDSDSITITTRFGSQKIEISSDVTVNKPSSGNISDIEKGTEILAQGKRDSEDKIQAKVIQIISQ